MQSSNRLSSFFPLSINLEANLCDSKSALVTTRLEIEVQKLLNILNGEPDLSESEEIAFAEPSDRESQPVNWGGELPQMLNCPGWHPSNSDHEKTLKGKPRGSYLLQLTSESSIDSSFSYTIHYVAESQKFKSFNLRTELSWSHESGEYVREYFLHDYRCKPTRSLNEKSLEELLQHLKETLVHPISSNETGVIHDPLAGYPFMKRGILEKFEDSAKRGDSECSYYFLSHGCYGKLKTEFESLGFSVTGKRNWFTLSGWKASSSTNCPSALFERIHLTARSRKSEIASQKETQETEEVKRLGQRVLEFLRVEKSSLDKWFWVPSVEVAITLSV